MTTTSSGRVSGTKANRAVWAFATSLGLMWVLACAAALLLAAR